MKLLNWLNDFSTPEGPESSELSPALKARLSELEQIPVDKIMIPRALITGLDADVQLRRVRRLKSSKLAYFPVYRGDLDQILGWVSKEKVLELLNDQREESGLLNHVRPAGEVSDQASVADLADAFLAAASPFLVVKNSQRQTLGIVPLNEFVEKIFGFESSSPSPSLELMNSPNSL